MSKELDVPVFLYAKSAAKPDRVRLPDIRKGEYEALEEKFNDPSYKQNAEKIADQMKKENFRDKLYKFIINE